MDVVSPAVKDAARLSLLLHTLRQSGFQDAGWTMRCNRGENRTPWFMCRGSESGLEWVRLCWEIAVMDGCDYAGSRMIH